MQTKQQVERKLEDILDAVKKAEDEGRLTSQTATTLRGDIKMGAEIESLFIDIADNLPANESLSMEEIWTQVDEIAIRYGHEYGIARPDISEDKVRRMVLAEQTPLYWQMLTQFATEEAQRAHKRGLKVRNSWHSLSDKTVLVIQTDEGPMALPQYHSGARLRKLVETAMARSGSGQTAESELRALDSLRKRINQSQFDSYVVNGMFPEYSKKSGLHYIFRKGLPTLVISYSGRFNWLKGETKREDQGRVISCLCFHPYGYHEYTHAGVMTPTDEVIATLLYMRADEHFLWRKSGQWAASDLRAGL